MKVYEINKTSFRLGEEHHYQHLYFKTEELRDAYFQKLINYYSKDFELNILDYTFNYNTGGEYPKWTYEFYKQETEIVIYDEESEPKMIL